MRRLIGLVAFFCLLAGIAWAALGVRLNIQWDDVYAALWGKDGPQETRAAGTGTEQSPDRATARLEDSDHPKSQGGAPRKPHSAGRSPFDVARISPNGVSVFAGKSTPNATVTVRADGKVVGRTRTDDNGEWVIASEHKFGSDDPQLEVTTTMPGDDSTTATDGQDQGGRSQGPLDSSTQSKVAVDDAPPGARAKAVTDKLMTALQGLVDEARAKFDDGKHADQGSLDKKDNKTASSRSVLNAPIDNGQSSEAKIKSERGGLGPGTQGATYPQEGPVAASPPSVSDRGGTEMALAEKGQGHSAQRSNVIGTLPGVASKRDDVIVPVPLKFIYRKAELTKDGKKAASLLLEYVRLKGFKAITLSGHADERGSKALNMDLSLSRLHTVARYLRKGGYGGGIELVAKGEAEPFSQVNRSKFLQEELWELDRRVELRMAQ